MERGAQAVSFDPDELTGHARAHVRQFSDPRFAARPEVADAFLALRAQALLDGIDLLPIASWRPFEAQLRIWNRKFSAEATLRDIHGQPRDHATLSPQALVWAILGWSGLPGATRRHWGTDIDVWDRNALPPGQRTQLLPHEVAPGGVFERLHAWLDVHIEQFGFFRPYRTYRGGMFPEPWHLSFAGSARVALDTFDIDMLAATIRQADGMLGRDLVLEMLPEIMARHVRNVDSARVR
jgi:LAS superfamily LD-carboxypeptidase LdcB